MDIQRKLQLVCEYCVKRVTEEYCVNANINLNEMKYEVGPGVLF